jgi:periplasmic mercuric ion binding protein
MKTLKFFIASVLAVTIGINSFSQTNKQVNKSSVKTETVKVLGNCEICKARIEKAAKAEGAAKAEWNDDSKLLSVTYDTSKTSLDKICKKIATAGHDNDKAKADDKAYNSLPGCCKYDRK